VAFLNSSVFGLTKSRLITEKNIGNSRYRRFRCPHFRISEIKSVNAVYAATVQLLRLPSELRAQFPPDSSSTVLNVDSVRLPLYAFSIYAAVYRNETPPSAYIESHLYLQESSNADSIFQSYRSTSRGE
jgi:hypothetical protein